MYQDWLKEKLTGSTGGGRSPVSSSLVPPPLAAPLSGAPIPTLLGRPINEYDPAVIAELIRRVNGGAAPVTTPSGGAVPQSAATYQELVSRGPGYGSQAARVANAPKTPVQPTGPIGPAVPANVNAPSMAAAIAGLNSREIDPGVDPMRERELALEATQAGITKSRDKVAADAGITPSTPDSLTSLAGSVAGAVVDDVKHPWEIPGDLASGAKDVLMEGLMPAYAYGQHKVDLSQAQFVYDAAKGKHGWDDPVLTLPGSDQTTPSVSGVWGEVLNLFGADMDNWAKENQGVVIHAYEQGWDQKDKDGTIIGHIEPGREAVLAAYYDSTNFAQAMLHQTVTDPLNALPILGILGKGLAGVKAGEEAGPVARAIAKGASKAGDLLVAGNEATQLPEKIAVGGAQSIGSAARSIPAVDRAVTWATTPAARAVDEVLTRVRSQALHQVAGSDVISPFRGMTPADATQPFVGTNLDTAAATTGDALAAATDALPSLGTVSGDVTGDLVAKVGPYQVVRDPKGMFTLLDDQGKRVSGVSYDTLAGAQREAETLVNTTPVVLAAAETAPAVSGTGEPVVRGEALPKYLQPNRSRGLSVDRAAYQIGPKDPAAANAFFDQYEPLALNYAAEQTAIDTAAKRTSGFDTLMNRAQKAYSEVKFGKAANRIFEETTGVPANPFRTRYTALDPQFVPNDDWWKQTLIGQNDSRFGIPQVGVAPGVAGPIRDEFNAVVEAALAPNESSARRILNGLRTIEDPRAKRLATQLDTWRAELYPPGEVSPLAAKGVAEAAIPTTPEIPGAPVTPDVPAEPTPILNRVNELAASGTDVGPFYQAFDQIDQTAQANIDQLRSIENTQVGPDILVTRTKRIALEAEREHNAARIFRDTLQQDPPPFAYQYADYPADLVPTNNRWPRPVQDKLYQWFQGVASGDVPIEQFDAMVERALGPDDVLASEVRASIRHMDKGTLGDDIADALKTERARIFPEKTDPLQELPDSIMHREHIRERVATEDVTKRGKQITAVSDPVKLGSKWDLTVTYDDGSTRTLYFDAKQGRLDPNAGALPAKQRLEALMQPGAVTPTPPVADIPAAAAAPTVAETGQATLPIEGSTGNTPTPTTPEPARWVGQPEAGAATGAKDPYIGLWDQAKAAKTADDGAKVFVDYAEQQFGPRDAAVLKRGYKSTKAGSGWRRADQEAQSFRESWTTYRGDGPNPYPSGRPPIEGSTPVPEDPFPAGGYTTETIGGNKPAKASLDAPDGITPAEDLDLLRTAYRMADIDEKQFNLLNEQTSFGGTWKRAKDGTRTLDGAEEKRIFDVFMEKLTASGDSNQAIRETMAELSPNAPIGDRTRIGKALGDLYNGINTFGRQHRMFGQLRGPQGIATDMFGDVFTQATSGNLEAVPQSLNFKRMWSVYKDIRDGSAKALAVSETGQTAKRLGMVAEDVGHGFGHEIAGEGDMAGQALVKKVARFVGANDETAAKWSKAGGLLTSERYKNFRQAADINRRWSLFGTEVGRQLPKEREEFFGYLTTRARTGERVDDLISALGDEFSPADVRRLAKEAGFDPGQVEDVSRRWRSSVNRIESNAFKEQNRVAFDFAATKADEALKKVFLFHTWQFRAAPLYLRNALHNPALMSAYEHIAQDLHRECELRNKGQCGYLEMWTTATGTVLFMNPTYLLSSALINLEPERWNDPDATMLDKVLRTMPAMVAPAFQGIISAMGYSSVDAPDWLSLTTDRKVVGSIVNYGRAHGWFGDKEAASLGDAFYGDFLVKLNRAAFDYLGKYLPGTQPPKGLDPQRRDNEFIQTRIRDLIYADNDIPKATSIDDLEAQYPAVADILRTSLLAWQTGKPDDYANQAYRDYTSGNLEAQTLSLAVPGGIMTRSESQDTLTRMRDKARTAGATDLAQSASGALAVGRLGSPAATNLEFGSAVVANAGLPENRAIMDGWNAIAYGDNPGAYIQRSGETIGSAGGDINAAITGMDQSTRELLADQWVASQGPDAQAMLEQARADKSAAIDANPDEAAYRAWSNAARDYTGGPTKFREDTAAGNPNYARYIEGYDGYVEALKKAGIADPPSLDEYGVSRNAYLAYKGQPATTFSEAPISTNSGNAPYSAVTPTTGNAGTGTGTAKTSDPAQQLVDDLRKYQTQVSIYDQAVKAYTGNPAASLLTMNPQLRSATAWHLGNEYGMYEPTMPTSVSRYLNWAEIKQSNGQPSDIGSYLAWRQSIQSALGATDVDVDTVIDAAINGSLFSDTSLGQAIPDMSQPMYGTSIGG